MSRSEHLAQRNMVRAALVLAESRKDRHEVYQRVSQKPCPTCGARGAFLFCFHCDGRAA